MSDLDTRALRLLSRVERCYERAQEALDRLGDALGDFAAYADPEDEYPGYESSGRLVVRRGPGAAEPHSDYDYDAARERRERRPDDERRLTTGGY